MEVQFSRNTREAMMAAERYERLVPASQRRGYTRISLIMDLTAADGVNGNARLDWGRLLNADDFNFLHDLGGIARHLDRETGAITNHFLPRFTLKQAA